MPDVSFNNPDELGSGKELVDKVSGLIAVFQNPAIDFKSNRASGDDIIGDAYEYFMMKFAQESGKSKGQFYTPSEVSRIIARLIGIGSIKNDVNKKWTLYDPAAGSGSLLIRAADEAPVDEGGASIVTIFGQEKYPDTAGLAKMNFILHNKGTGEIKSGNTLSTPQYLDEFGELKKFDFIVMNPPFSDKAWTDGIKPSNDKYKRFDDYGIPPEKNGDYAWFLHVLKSLSLTGKAGIVLPHGVLFRGNAEETIRKQILAKKWIKGIVSLPANLFYGTGIPACIVIIDKENAESRTGIFMIDASSGYKKDGSKNRLREQDIEKIVRYFNGQILEEGYSRFVTYQSILEENDGNLNIPRYIPKVDDTLPQNIAAHLNGGIPKTDIDSLERLWTVAPELKSVLFSTLDAEHSIYKLAVASNDIEETIYQDVSIVAEKDKELVVTFSSWRDEVREILLSITSDTSPKVLIRSISGKILAVYHDSRLLDKYDVYDCLLNYWNEKLQDDVYAIKVSGYEAGREIEYEYAKKKAKDENGDTISVDDKTKVKYFDGALIPRTIIERKYFADESAAITALEEQCGLIESELVEMHEEESGEDGLLLEVLNENGNSIPKAKLTKRIKELEAKKTSEEADLLSQIAELFTVGKTDEIEALLKQNPTLATYELQNKKGAFIKSKIAAAFKDALANAILPEIYADEYAALIAYQDKLSLLDEANKNLKTLRKELDDKVKKKYGELTVDEIKHLLFDEKWMVRLYDDIGGQVDQVLNALSSKALLIAKRYEHTLRQIEDKTASSKAAVKAALERMGYKW